MKLVNILADSTITRGFCIEPGVTNVTYFLGVLIFAIKIIIPIGMIILGSIDMTKAVLANDDTAIKKNALALVKRFAIGVLIFFIPTIVNFALGLVYNFNDDFQNSMKNCSSCLLSPTSSETKKIGISQLSKINEQVESGKCVRTEDDYSDGITCKTLKKALKEYNGSIYEFDPDKAEESIKECSYNTTNKTECLIKKCFKKVSQSETINKSSNSGKSTGSFIWPVNGHTNVTYEFGSRNGHQGMDISDNTIEGADIIASDGGTISLVYNNCTDNYAKDSIDVGGRCGGGYGNHVIIDHGNGLSSLYAHMKPSSITVNAEDKVKKGQKIGEVGTTGDSNGYHLHFEILLNGIRVNPRSYLDK